MPMEGRACRTSSSLKGLMMATMSFMAVPPSSRPCALRRRCGAAGVPALPARGGSKIGFLPECQARACLSRAFEPLAQEPFLGDRGDEEPVTGEDEAAGE